MSTVIHQAGVEIDESGTTASAATAVIFKLTSAPLNSPFHFNADHPFLFFILDKANNIPLFAGKVVNPVHV